MCSSKEKEATATEATPTVAKMNGRPVLQPTCNRTVNPSIDRRKSLQKSPSITPPPLPTSAPNTVFPEHSASNKSPSPRPRAVKRGNELNSSSEKVNNVVSPRHSNSNNNINNIRITLERKKSKSFKEGGRAAAGEMFFLSISSSNNNNNTNNRNVDAAAAAMNIMSYSSSLIVESPGSIAAVRREQMALQHAQRKMRIAHYGRSKSAKFDSSNSFNNLVDSTHPHFSDDHHHYQPQKRCTFITANSDPIYVAYHDQEWGVPVHDDNMLFELLVLSAAQVGSDWTCILKKRQDFRDAFSYFDAEAVAKLTDKQIMSISTEYSIDISRVRGVVDNSHRILEVKREFGSFEKYIWGFVNNKPISRQYKFGHKIPVKTSKSESISKSLVRRGFRFVGPTVVHSFLQSAGLTNDHLITCHRHLPCTLLTAAAPPRIRPVDQEPPPAPAVLLEAPSYSSLG